MDCLVLPLLKVNHVSYTSLTKSFAHSCNGTGVYIFFPQCGHLEGLL